MNTVLVVGERPEQATALAASLGILGIEAMASARDFKLAMRSLVAHRISLIVLDVDESAESRTFFEMIHEIVTVPIIARGPMSKTDLVISYLERGAVDYCGRATPPALLAAKIQTLTRSKADSSDGADSVLLVGDLAIDLRNRTVVRGTTEVSLTRLEFRLLSVLAEKIGRPCTREELLLRVWGEDFASCSHYLRLYIGYLRQKLEDDPSKPRLLINEWGYGYRLTEPNRSHKQRVGRPALRLAQG